MWFGNATGNRDNVGGYEIRLKEGEDALNRARNSNREIWETSTVYMFVGKHTPTVSLDSRNIPVLVYDTGTRLVIIFDWVNCELANRLVEEWHWQRKSGVDEDKESLDSNTLLHDAHKFGFRVLHKSRWDELKEEYLARRTQLLERVAAKADDEMEVDPHKNEEEEEETFSHKRKRSPTPPPLPPPLAPPATKPSQSTTTLHSRYPHGCLIFVKNVHPETNKTTLRTLFSRAFPDEQQGVGLDYVDFTKGMNSCYLRLATPTHTTHLLAHFKDTPTTQTHGLDTTGSSNASINAVVMEVVDGKREELYWEKVPEKVRRQAVEKAVKGLSRGGGEAGDGGEGGQRKRQRKRRGE
ncbi:hypothetical protein EUX98_g2290 [Antrodiella citrinella]|uniref:XRRM domain-containing protein n=1 Tax=Antrodiella citrinella TaxID=2447956 RepID=A0A4S4MZF9_9APHY|nr:hypothetical protein EUX98_g2290 [Antrodiella citrinella]